MAPAERITSLVAVRLYRFSLGPVVICTPFKIGMLPSTPVCKTLTTWVLTRTSRLLRVSAG